MIPAFVLQLELRRISDLLVMRPGMRPRPLQTSKVFGVVFEVQPFSYDHHFDSSARSLCKIRSWVSAFFLVDRKLSLRIADLSNLHRLLCRQADARLSKSPFHFPGD